VGTAIIAAAFTVIRLAPHSVWSQELLRQYGIKPSGERGNRTRRDHLRSAGLGAFAAAALMVTGSLANLFAERVPINARSWMIASSYMFVSFLLCIMAVTSTVRSLWKAAAWRMELPDTPDHRRALADALDHLLDGGLTAEERRDYLEVTYLQPQLDQIRRSTLKLSKQHQGDLPKDFHAQIKRWTAGIRASAGPHESTQAAAEPGE
jgi:hypothetical protein